MSLRSQCALSHARLRIEPDLQPHEHAFLELYVSLTCQELIKLWDGRRRTKLRPLSIFISTRKEARSIVFARPGNRPACTQLHGDGTLVILIKWGHADLPAQIGLEGQSRLESAAEIK